MQVSKRDLVRHGLLATFGTTLASSSGAAVESPDQSWSAKDKHSDAQNNDEYVHDAGVTIGDFGATYIDSRDTWEHNIRAMSAAHSHEYSTMVGGWTARKDLASQHLDVSTDSTDVSLWKPSDSKYYGATPNATDSTTNYDEFALEIAKLALGQVDDLVEFAITASDLVDALYDREDTNDGNNHITMDKDAPIGAYWERCSHYMWFLADKSGSGESYVTTQSWMTHHKDTEKVGVEFTLGLWTDELRKASESQMSVADPSITSKLPLFGQSDDRGLTPSDTPGVEKSDTWDGPVPPATHPSQMSRKERRAIELEVIPEGEIRKRGAELPIPEKTVEEMANEPGPGYYAHTPPVSVGMKRL